jgi:hypothetical protein
VIGGATILVVRAQINESYGAWRTAFTVIPTVVGMALVAMFFSTSRPLLHFVLTHQIAG